MQLSGAHVLLTGASRGIGARLALLGAERGADVTLVARSRDALEALAERTGGRALPADLGDPAEREGLVGRAEAAAGRPVDVLVNTAGLDGVGSLLDLSPEQMHGLFQVNLLAPAELCRQVLPGMVARGRGHIVNTSSGFSTITAPGLTTYCSTKAGLSHFTAGLRDEVSGSGVGVTLVELGPVHTEMYGDIQEHRLSGPVLRRFVGSRLGREVDPEDVAVSVLDAVGSGAAHVVLPRRMVPVVAFTWLPRRVSRLVQTGLPKR